MNGEKRWTGWRRRRKRKGNKLKVMRHIEELEEQLRGF